MTDLKATRADQDIAIELCSEDWDAHAVIDADTEEGICCIECGPIAAALTKVRQEEQAKTDEAVAAVVGDMRNRVRICVESLERSMQNPEDKFVLRPVLSEVLFELPTHQQILADMKERVREERDKEWEEKFDSMLGSENKNAFTGPLAARAYAYATVIAEEAEARLRDQIQDYQTDPNYDNRYVQGQDEAMAKMREPLECGHSKANWEYSEQHGHMSYGEPSFIDASFCTACAQQRELRKIVETLSSFMQDATPELKAKSGPSQQFWWGLVESARRALGEKEATTEEK